MLLSALSFLVVAQSSSEVPEGLMNSPVCSLDGADKHFRLENMKIHSAEWREIRTGILRQIPCICTVVNWRNVGSGAWFL